LYGDLDLSAFVGLKELKIYGQFKSLTGLSNTLESIDISTPLSDSLDLSIFTPLTKLKRLSIGIERNGSFRSYAPGFRGSLKSLENCKGLEYLDISGNNLIKTGLKNLPLETIKDFRCDGTIFKQKIGRFQDDHRV